LHLRGLPWIKADSLNMINVNPQLVSLMPLAPAGLSFPFPFQPEILLRFQRGRAIPVAAWLILAHVAKLWHSEALFGRAIVAICV